MFADAANHGLNELVELNHSHDAADFIPEHPTSNILEPWPNEGFGEQFTGAQNHVPFFQFGIETPPSFLKKRKTP